MIIETRILEKATRLAKRCRLPGTYHNVIRTWPDESCYRYFIPVYEQRLGQLAFLLNRYHNVLLEQPDRYNAEFQMHLLLITYEHELIEAHMNHSDLSIEVFMSKCEIENIMRLQGPTNILLRKLTRYLLKTFRSPNWQFQYGNLLCLREIMQYFASYDIPGCPKKLMKQTMTCIHQLLQTTDRRTFSFALSLLKSSLTNHTCSLVGPKALIRLLDDLTNAPVELRHNNPFSFLSALDKCVASLNKSSILKSSQRNRCDRIMEIVMSDITNVTGIEHAEHLLMVLLRLLYSDYEEFAFGTYICRGKHRTNKEFMEVASHGAPRFAKSTIKLMELLTKLSLKYGQCSYFIKLISLALLVMTRLPHAPTEAMMYTSFISVIEYYDQFTTDLTEYYNNWKLPETVSCAELYLKAVDALVFMLSCLCYNLTAFCNRYLPQLSVSYLSTSILNVNRYIFKITELIQTIRKRQQHFEGFVRQHGNDRLNGPIKMEITN
ncbi:uncharacterized protein LOC131431177 [Malaya genurostris]|uniref:uncharacterized protein LOC131431177 n=1 Tax=Malaya genurostris TaxID=325434 RepID=UPI0026F383F6|nr:uncharacterized protein LOC131431177 [Malaya genurostris]XP_058452721.1 uncharacterized protein LOC131431177 [Malaya genurostris]